MFDANLIIAFVVFGGLGMIYISYGKWKDLWQPKALGFALMFYPYVVRDPVWIWVIGGVLSLSIFFARD